MITIKSMGSKWAGEAPDTLADLHNRLTRFTLDPTFEQYGNFATLQPGGVVHFWGNFFDLSYVFNLETDDAGVIAGLITAIHANQATTAYKAAKRARLEHDRIKHETLTSRRRHSSAFSNRTRH